MIFTANVMMYHGNRGLIQEGETINFSEEEIKEFEPDYFKQLFSGNEDEVAKIFNPKSNATKNRLLKLSLLKQSRVTKIHQMKILKVTMPAMKIHQMKILAMKSLRKQTKRKPILRKNK